MTEDEKPAQEHTLEFAIHQLEQLLAQVRAGEVSIPAIWINMSNLPADVSTPAKRQFCFTGMHNLVFQAEWVNLAEQQAYVGIVQRGGLP